MKITLNPATEVSQFGYVEAGKNRLRIVKVDQAVGPKAPYLNWEFELADPNIKATDGKSKPGHVFEITTLKEDAQFALRALVESCGLEWGAELETEEMIGLEFDANLGIDQYEGNMKNVVKRYIPVK